MGRTQKERCGPKPASERMRAFRRRQKEKLIGTEESVIRQSEAEKKRSLRANLSPAQKALVNFKRRQNRLNASLQKEAESRGSSKFVLKNPYATASAAGC